MWYDLIAILVITFLFPALTILLTWLLVFRPYNRERRAKWKYEEGLKNLRSRKGK